MSGTPTLVSATLHGPRVTLRRPTEADVDALVTILTEPEVSPWWTHYTADRVREELVVAPEGRVIEVERTVVGGMLVIPSEDNEYPTVVMHIFLTTSERGKALGAEALAVAIRDAFAHGMQRVTLDPNVHNEGAIRSYERLGFRRIGVLRDYQLRDDGTYDDALFLDLTRSEFPDGPPLPAMAL